MVVVDIDCYYCDIFNKTKYAKMKINFVRCFFPIEFLFRDDQKIVN